MRYSRLSAYLRLLRVSDSWAWSREARQDLLLCALRGGGCTNRSQGSCLASRLRLSSFGQLDQDCRWPGLLPSGFNFRVAEPAECYEGVRVSLVPVVQGTLASPRNNPFCLRRVPCKL